MNMNIYNDDWGACMHAPNWRIDKEIPIWDLLDRLVTYGGDDDRHGLVACM